MADSIPPRTRWSLQRHFPELVLVLVLTSNPAFANEAFTEPFRTVSVAAPESGIVTTVLVREGAVVEEGQPLVRLDVELHRALLAIAEASKEATGRIDGARAEVEMRRKRAEAVERVRAGGHASQEELDRSVAEAKISEGALAQALESLRQKELEYEKIRLQIERRTIRAPLGGVVTGVLKEPGEFTSPNDPDLLTIVRLDPLVATFHLMGPEAAQFKKGDKVRVAMTESGQAADAEVDYVCPVMDAESGTVAIRVRIPNPDGAYQSGQPCSIDSPQDGPAAE